MLLTISSTKFLYWIIILRWTWAWKLRNGRLGTARWNLAPTVTSRDIFSDVTYGFRRNNGGRESRRTISSSSFNNTKIFDFLISLSLSFSLCHPGLMFLPLWRHRFQWPSGDSIRDARRCSGPKRGEREGGKWGGLRRWLLGCAETIRQIQFAFMQMRWGDNSWKIKGRWTRSSFVSLLFFF